MSVNSSRVGIMYEALIRKLLNWANDVSNIKVVLIVGSRARSKYPADEWSDLDAIIVTSNPDFYVSTTDWIGNMGTPILTFIEPTATGVGIERRVLYENMLDVDFSIVPFESFSQLTKGDASTKTKNEIKDLVNRGIISIIDKAGFVAEVQKLVASYPSLIYRNPNQEEFAEIVNDFLYHAVFAAKHLKRGELWWTATCLDCHMQRLMLRMMEWHAHATHSGEFDTWFRGRFLEKWADSQILQGLTESFARYDSGDIKRALRASMALFRQMGTEVACKLSLVYPTDADEKVASWIDTCIT